MAPHKRAEVKMEWKTIEIDDEQETADIEKNLEAKAQGAPLMRRILVIEDSPEHMEDAKRFFSGKSVEVVYASTYIEAGRRLDRQYDESGQMKTSIDGVISDIYFPLTSQEPWTQPEPIGVLVAVELSKEGIPFVLNTAGFHHGARYEWINILARGHGWALADASRDPRKEADSKRWDIAYKALEEKMKELKK